MKSKTKKRICVKKEVLDALEPITLMEKKRFSMENNPNNYPTIWWMIAEYILKPVATLSVYNEMLANYAKQVRNAFQSVEDELRKKGFEIYKDPPDGKRIEAITIARADEVDPDVCLAHQQRVEKNVIDRIKKQAEDAKFKGYRALLPTLIQEHKAITTEQERLEITGETTGDKKNE